MGLNMSGNCDLCGKKIDINPAIIGDSPLRITIEDIILGTQKEAVTCVDCGKLVKKSLDNVSLDIEKNNISSDSESSKD